jgi:hypothetical protein
MVVPALLLALVAAASAAAPPRPPPLQVLPLQAEPGAYEVRVRGVRWLRSGDTAFRANGGWLTVQDGSLALAGNRSGAGSDALGGYFERSLTWRGAGGFEARTDFRSYGTSLATFQQVWVSGAAGTVAGDWDSVNAAFPSFSLMPAGAGAPALASAAWRGQFMDQGSAGQSVGMWPPFLGSQGRIFEATEGGGGDFHSGGSGGVVTGREAAIGGGAIQTPLHLFCMGNR